MTVAQGLCQCGCGGQPLLARRDDARIGAVKGQPYRFIKGHHRRREHPTVGRDGYRLVVAPENPRAINRRVHEHVLVVERALGHHLPPAAVVHHVNEIKSDNRNENLAALQDQREHVDLHTRLRVLRAGGNPWTQRLCCVCHRAKDITDFYAEKLRALSSRCKACSRAVALERQRQKRGAA